MQGVKGVEDTDRDRTAAKGLNSRPTERQRLCDVKAKKGGKRRNSQRQWETNTQVSFMAHRDVQVSGVPWVHYDLTGYGTDWKSDYNKIGFGYGLVAFWMMTG